MPGILLGMPSRPFRPVVFAAVLLVPLLARADDCWSVAVNDAKAGIARANQELAKATKLVDKSEFTLCRGYAHDQLGEVNEAMADFEAGLVLARQSGDRSVIANALSLRGELRQYRGEFDRAIEDLHQAYELYTALGKAERQRYVLNSMANLYSDRRVAAYDKAIEYYRQLLALNEKDRGPREIATSHYNIAATLDSKGDYAAALAEYRIALGYERQVKDDPESIVYTLRGMALVLSKLGRQAEALARVDEALAGAIKSGDEELLAQVRLTRAGILRQVGRLQEAARELESVRTRFEKTESYRFLEKTHDERAQTYAALGDWRRAWEARGDLMAVREKLTDRLREEHVSRLRIQFDTEKKEQENRALVRENALRTRALADASRIRTLQAVVIVLGAALVAFLVVMARRMRRLALTDELTRLPNRRHLLSLADEQVRHAKSGGRGFSVLALDIDHFKRINDTYGHDAGDVVLRRVADTCRRALRRHDRIGRTGGEEFVVVLPDTNAQLAADVAERLRAAVAAADFSDIATDLAITISIGVTQWMSSDDFHAVAKRADDSLYRAKEGGRNRVVLATA
jgi:diguanylate cyclase (GGDEF)-like protein